MWLWVCPVIYNKLQVKGNDDDIRVTQAKDNDE